MGNSPSQVDLRALQHTYRQIRHDTVQICEPLAREDYVVQPIPEVSPPKWHLGHTTWFFEEMILKKYVTDYKPFDRLYPLLFNSYYKSAGKHWLQGKRGCLSRPSVSEIYAYRKYVDEAMADFCASPFATEEAAITWEIGLHHEQQHQELLWMDIKFILFQNPSLPKHVSLPLLPCVSAEIAWQDFEEGVYEVGCGGDGFAYDNESPRHKTYLYPFALCCSLVSNGDYLRFMEAGGYQNPEYWLSQGWDWIQEQQVLAPLYWFRDSKGVWREYTLHGDHALDFHAPVAHISYHEAYAFAQWCGMRLPTEYEIEVFLSQRFSESLPSLPKRLHPSQDAAMGQLWCWTSSSYGPYPRQKKYSGALSEYNAKFMCNQFVLRGGSFATPPGHYRPSYRNFFDPQQRWMFSGLRLAKDI
ncbi:MAG: ergothioneine biosynthesis protein EgtB [Zetaproteobacteria bacterium]|nr:ergothioneine biosynthesis protein EgtB [Zetaproteobacteria bacterium]